MPSVEEFGDAFFDAEPVLIKGGVSHWPALTRWLDKEYLRRIAGKATVPVEIGGQYLSSNMQRADMPLELYLDYLEAADAMAEGDVPEEQMAYMAQASVPALLPDDDSSSSSSSSNGNISSSSSSDRSTTTTTTTTSSNRSTTSSNSNGDVATPAICAALGRGDQYSRMVWMGPKGTVTPLHRDPYHNCLCQVEGAKRVLLFDARDEERMYPIGDDPLQANSSRVDAERPDLARFPKFADAHARMVEVHPGDLLYIPRRWWHHVRALSRSASVSFWWL